MTRPGAPASAAERTELEEGDDEWAEELALRILLARVRPERRAEAAERVRSVVRGFEAGGPAARRRLPRMTGAAHRRARDAD